MQTYVHAMDIYGLAGTNGMYILVYFPLLLYIIVWFEMQTT